MNLRTLSGFGVAQAIMCVAWAQTTERVNISTSGIEANGQCYSGSISADGRYVVFEDKDATTLVPGDTNTYVEIFLRDRENQTTRRVSVNSAGVEGDGDSSRPVISANGRYVAFKSYATNLGPVDTNNNPDVFVRDLLLGTTERVSIATSGAQGLLPCSYDAAISADGRYVAFSSNSTNLVTPDLNGAADIFIRDRHWGTTELVSWTTRGTQADSGSASVAISADGNHVGFVSFASNLVPGDLNGQWDVFVRDRSSGGATELVSVGLGGVPGNGFCYDVSISANGRYVAFSSTSFNLVAGDSNGFSDVFVRDRVEQTTVRVSLGLGGIDGNGNSTYPSISPEGQYVAFQSDAMNLVPLDLNNKSDVFVRNVPLSTTHLVSVNTGGVQGNNHSYEFFSNSYISANGRFVAFESEADNLVSGDANGVIDVFVRDNGSSNPMVQNCFPGQGGIIPCPCGNPPQTGGLGCMHFKPCSPLMSGTLNAEGVSGLTDDGDGTPSVFLLATGLNQNVATVFFAGTNPKNATGVIHGAGIRCVTQNLKRMYTRTTTANPVVPTAPACLSSPDEHHPGGGQASAPTGTELSISLRSAAVGSPIQPGETRKYFVIYRDPQAVASCPSSNATVNVTNSGAITWTLFP